MSKRETKMYMCLHEPCTFKTDKRKAIYTHLVRTHSERKEDYECEYCNTMFELDSDIEQHLHVQHPQQPFTYTCVSRIEKVINKCANLGSETRRSNTPVKSVEQTSGSSIEKPASKAEKTSPVSKLPHLKPNISMRTRATVNEALNNLAKQPKHSTPATSSEASTQFNGNAEDDLIDEKVNTASDDIETETNDQPSTFISKPSGLKITLCLKKAAEKGNVSSDTPVTPPKLEPTKNEAVTQPTTPGDTPATVTKIHNTRGKAQVRIKDTKYYDKLEVYHHTDELGRRCCPFCDYKTSKNTIRVHLSGIHKLHFVKCSLCDYKAAFPHQITQHGMKFHKTTNLNVIQLSKEYRDNIISKLTTFDHEGIVETAQNDSNTMNTETKADVSDQAVVDDEDFPSEESYPTSADESDVTESADDRTSKVPKCQTSKTDYYSIQVENSTYMYSCNLCPFKTSVRATIYTHKYRHEEKSYRCGYCDFTSAPRSNVVHHCRVKHKNSPISVVENDSPEESDLKEEIQAVPGDNDEEEISEDCLPEGTVIVQPEPVEPEEHQSIHIPNHDIRSVLPKSTSGVPSGATDLLHDVSQGSELAEKTHQTIIKVPQFKRSFAATGCDLAQTSVDSKKPKLGEENQEQEYKLSLNKLYRINPSGSPKFMCALCSYACDTHPKMKHHLYRHRPQKYKCPYCDHRKYPRSYVVRHVRDTHRNKPVRVIDLSKGNEPEDIPEYMHEGAVDDVENNDADASADLSNLEESMEKQEPDNVKAENINASSATITDDQTTEQNEEVNALKNFAQTLNLRSVLTSNLNDDLFTQSPDVSPNFSDAVYTSTPLIESYLNGPYNGSNSTKLGNKNFDKKKSLKDYRVNHGQGPRYICNKCGYGTENYKTIHNHMYRHESQRYQCPYCGYRRSPKSFVENHIREVHKGHPVIVTELTVDQELTDTPVGSPRQCVTLKRKDDSTEPPPSISPVKVQKTETIAKPKSVKFPKPTSQAKTSSKLASDVDRPGSVSPQMPELLSPIQPAKSQGPTNVIKPKPSQPINAPTLAPPFRFIERNRTTFKTMYKCVFDPETCNHISKDKSKMKQHLFMHVEYKPWSCDFCDMTASQSSHIKNHVRTEHPGVPETSFKYKKHNYLEKHIEGFLTKGLFTVPVNEYRAIMDMKGNTKSSKQPTFARDEEGNLLCPYCSYKTKSGGLTDHVKMKHMQPRFKCHWCDYRAFYRSEVRKHHRKERSHFGLEFKTQELDLVRVMEGYKEQNVMQASEQTNASAALSLDPTQLLDDEDDDDDGRSDCSSSDGSSLGDLQQGYVEYTTEQLSDLCNGRLSKGDITPRQLSPPITGETAMLRSLNTKIGPDGSMKIVPKQKTMFSKIASSKSNTVSGVSSTKNSKFKCGYCSFSAALRVKVKMHCSKKHAEKVVSVIEPAAKCETLKQEKHDLHADDWKGTKFEQDLRKAGVSKLNLASLFPNSKRFQKPKPDNTDKLANSDDIQDKAADIDDPIKSRTSDNDSFTKSASEGQFKKPLCPALKTMNGDRKSNCEDVKKSAAVTNRRKIEIEHADKSLEHNDQKSVNNIESVDSKKFDKCTNNAILLQPNVSSDGKADDKSGVSDNCNETENQENETIEASVGPSGTVHTAFPNHTPVILEDDTDITGVAGENSENTTMSSGAVGDLSVDDRSSIPSDDECGQFVNGGKFDMDGTMNEDLTLEGSVSKVTENGSKSSENALNTIESKQDRLMFNKAKSKLSETHSKNGIVCAAEGLLDEG